MQLSFLSTPVTLNRGERGSSTSKLFSPFPCGYQDFLERSKSASWKNTEASLLLLGIMTNTVLTNCCLRAFISIQLIAIGYLLELQFLFHFFLLESLFCSDTNLNQLLSPFSFIKCCKYSWRGKVCFQKKKNCLFNVSVFSHTVMYGSLWPHGLYPIRLFRPWNSPGKNNEVGCHSLLQGLNPGILHCR